MDARKYLRLICIDRDAAGLPEAAAARAMAEHIELPEHIELRVSDTGARGLRTTAPLAVAPSAAERRFLAPRIDALG